MVMSWQVSMLWWDVPVLALGFVNKPTFRWGIS